MHSTRTPAAQQENIRAVTPACLSDIGQWLHAFDAAGSTRVGLWIHGLARRYPNTNVEQLRGLLRLDMLRRPQDADTQKLLKILEAPTKDFLDYLALVLEFVRLPRSEQDQWGGVLAWSRRGEPEAEPTAKQLRYLRWLGHRGPLPKTRTEASRRINVLLQRN